MTFYPDDAPIPTGLRSDEFLLRPLRAADVDLDYEAVMVSQETLRRDNGGRWPRPDFTLAEDLADLQGHEADFRTRRGLTYTVLDPTESRCLGCVYVYPPVDEDEDGASASTYAFSPFAEGGGYWARDYKAEVRFWVRPDRVADDLDRRLLTALVPWLRDEFAFARVLFRARADDARRMAIFGEAGLRVVETRPVRNTEVLLFA
jgi:hypothetical protein